MGTGQLLAGNLANLVITILAFLQVIPWPIAGYLIVGSVLLVVLSYFSSRGRAAATPEHIAESHGFIREVSHQEAGPRLEKKTGERKAESKEPTPRRPTRTTSSKENPDEEESPEENRGDAPTKIADGDYLSFDINLEKGEEVVGEVAAGGDVNVYVLNDENLTALDLDQEFWYEAGNEGVRNATIHFTAPEDGEWFFVVENAETKEITATVKVNVGRSPHSVPFLKTEGMGLPDARLDARLEGKS